MIDLRMDSDATRTTARAWQVDNERGLALAARADWAEAAEAFAEAADTLARTLPAGATGHEALALVLGNLAQAYFRAGRVDDAIQQAQRACALRVALAGEDGMPVARARMDLAVMLAASGRIDEATALVQRAIAAIEHHVGDEDARLAIVLENAARISLAAGAPAYAEPLLLRLHALLDVHGLSTAPAEQLLARIASVRAQQAEQAAARTERLGDAPSAPVAPDGDTLSPAMITPVSAVLAEVQRTMAAEAFVEPVPDVHTELLLTPNQAPPAPASAPDNAFAAFLEASMLAVPEWEDQPLRDAVELTDVLLRSTPAGVPVVADMATPDTSLISIGPDDVPSSGLGPDRADASSASSPQLGEPWSADVAAESPGFLTISADDRESSTPRDSEAIEFDLQLEPPVVGTPPLGFVVEYGVVDSTFDDKDIARPPESQPGDDALTAPLLFQPVEHPAPVQADAAHEAMPASTPALLRPVDIPHAAPVAAPLVAPAAMASTAPPSSAGVAPASRTPAGGVAPRATRWRPPRADGAGAATGAGRRSAPEQGGSSKLPFLIGGLAALGGGAAAWWFLLR
ncbi:MAG: tetratricopeptide repeat protein [Gemmatimonas sp.]|jgi:tetratricopeptide (TPR) repeat protein|uniref:tetratricopeptide repeat protein n=1 Tax=Gemmatimonas sp. TaxID=1962908 RepID=UPI00391EE407|nr:tetratricopeptide repeat protein [Gemmatimonadota bacterium]